MSEQTGGASAEHQLRWSTFASLLYESISFDANAALKVATETSSHRQVVQCSTFIHRAKFAAFQFNYQMSCRQGLEEDAREEFKILFDKEVTTFEAETSAVRARYLDVVSGNYDAKVEWLASNFDLSISTIAEAWQSIATAVKDGVFYSAVSIEEKASIVKALGFGLSSSTYA